MLIASARRYCILSSLLVLYYVSMLVKSRWVGRRQVWWGRSVAVALQAHGGGLHPTSDFSSYLCQDVLQLTVFDGVRSLMCSCVHLLTCVGAEYLKRLEIEAQFQ